MNQYSDLMEVGSYCETEILKECKKDPEAFEAVYNYYFDTIFLFIKKRINDKETAFDITQQVFFNALTNLKNYQQKGLPFSSYLFKIAINECNQHFRNKNKIRYVSINEQSINLLSEDILWIDNREKIAQLERAIQHLKHKELFLIELRYFEQESFKKISQLLGISENNCKVKVHRIIKKLKKHFKCEE
ncbi:MAG: sigma-70 family RNA polymerase sigma factor [Bacteroidota bacterium]